MYEDLAVLEKYTRSVELTDKILVGLKKKFTDSKYLMAGISGIWCVLLATTYLHLSIMYN